MDKVGFLVWYSDLAIGAENNSLVSNFLNRACDWANRNSTKKEVLLALSSKLDLSVWPELELKRLITS